MAKTMQDNLAGQMTILKSQLEELAISFSDILIPAIHSIVSHIQGLVDKLNQLDPQTKETIVKIALVVAALRPMLIALGKTVLKIAINNYYNNDNSRTVNQTNNSPKALSRLEIYK